MSGIEILRWVMSLSRTCAYLSFRQRYKRAYMLILSAIHEPWFLFNLRFGIQAGRIDPTNIIDIPVRGYDIWVFENLPTVSLHTI